jgi:hypothetical protein
MKRITPVLTLSAGVALAVVVVYQVRAYQVRPDANVATEQAPGGSSCCSHMAMPVHVEEPKASDSCGGCPFSSTTAATDCSSKTAAECNQETCPSEKSDCGEGGCPFSQASPQTVVEAPDTAASSGDAG